jgi:hypothetical protein
MKADWKFFRTILLIAAFALAFAAPSVAQFADSDTTDRAVTGYSVAPHRARTVIRDTIYYDVPRWDDLRLTSNAINPVGPIAAPDVSTTTGSLLFSGTADNACVILFELPETLKPGYDSLYLHLHWSKTTAAAGSVRWTMTYHIHDVDSLADDETAEVRLMEATAISSTQKHMVSSIGIPNTVRASSIIHITLYRRAIEAGDDYEADVDLMLVDLRYPLDRPGGNTSSPSE